VRSVQSEIKREMIERNIELPISEQCRILEFPRCQVYKKCNGYSAQTLEIMRLIDLIYTDSPTMGSRGLSKEITLTYGIHVGRTKIRRLMREMGIRAIYPQKQLTLANKEHKIYPYLLRNLPIERVNQVWSTDITYIHMGQGFVYLAAVIDWYSRKVLSWKLSTTMDLTLCTEVLNEALEKYGNPEIFNTDQGSQYTSNLHTSILKDHGIRISMDGKGRALDNIFVERLWRTVKQEEVYLKEYQTVREAKESLGKYFGKYNTRRRHQSLDYNYPDDIYFERVKLKSRKDVA